MTQSLCLVPKITATGGPAAFQARLIAGAAELGVEVHHDIHRPDIGAYLVIGAPLHGFGALLRAKLTGKKIVHRLNGMNWLHKVRPSGALYGLKADFANQRIAWFRRFIATDIVYQSQFCKDHWNEVYGATPQRSALIYNGVDTAEFSPSAETPRRWVKGAPVHILIAEGNLQHGSEVHLQQALQLANRLERETQSPTTLTIVGNVPEDVRRKAEAEAEKARLSVRPDWKGVLSKPELIRFERSATFFISVEPQPACPNAVIEALSVGLPVLGFDTGSLKDIVGNGGIAVDYGADFTRLEAPDPDALYDGATRILSQRAEFSRSARETALERFSLEKMTRDYLDFCELG